MKSELTDRQKEILDAIADFSVSEGRPPSIPELMKIFGISSPNGVAKHLKALEAKGYLDRKKGARGLVIIHSADDDQYEQECNIEDLSEYGIRKVPLVGSIAAGSPILAQENIEDNVPLPDVLSGTKDTFLLRVKGDSMIEEGILSGDLVVIEKCDSVHNGDIAAVLVEDEATLKRFYLKGNRAILEPANAAYDPIEIDLADQNCQILGRLIGLIRSYTSRL